MSISGGAANAMGTGAAPASVQPMVAVPAAPTHNPAPTNPPKAAPVSAPAVEPNFDDIPF
jgi:hypothetical protein